MAAPTAVEPSASPLAVVPVLPWCVAVALKLPSMFSPVPVPRLASVRLSATVMAKEPPTPVPSPAVAPDEASVVVVWLPVALSVTSSPPVRMAPFSSCASVVLSATFTAMDTPTPVLPPSALAVACTSVSMVLAAVSVTSPSPACVSLLPFRAASVCALDTFNANDPATPVSVPLAPDVALAPNLCLVLPPTFFMVAVAVIP